MGSGKKVTMKNFEQDLIKYRNFLETIPLQRYREELKDIKWVEQDLPKELLPLNSIFKFYWEKREFLDFESWFENFWKEINEDPNTAKVLKWFKKYYFDKDDNGWFKKGFKARMYRTWVSVLTQLDFCYLFEFLSVRMGKKIALECNADLDKRGIDARINNINFQITKISQRKEAKVMPQKKEIIVVPYPVFDIEDFKRKIESPRVKNKNKEIYKRMIEAFEKYFIRLRNGFVVFGEDYLKSIIENLDSKEKIKQIIKKISAELSGE